MLTGQMDGAEPAVPLVPPNTWVVPPGPLFRNIPLLWGILDRLVVDWHGVAIESQTIIDTACKNDGPDGARTAFNSLYEHIQSHFIQSLFSYVMLFLTLEDAYDCLYRSLEDLNDHTRLHVDHRRRPSEPDIRRRIGLVRNKSIAHLGQRVTGRSLRPFTTQLGSEDVVDSVSGLRWDLAYPTRADGTPIVEDIVFGGVGVILENRFQGEVFRSKDREVGPLRLVHDVLGAYLADYDEVCADYLTSIHARLPVEVDGARYE